MLRNKISIHKNYRKPNYWILLYWSFLYTEYNLYKYNEMYIARMQDCVYSICFVQVKMIFLCTCSTTDNRESLKENIMDPSMTRCNTVARISHGMMIPWNWVCGDISEWLRFYYFQQTSVYLAEINSQSKQLMLKSKVIIINFCFNS